MKLKRDWIVIDITQQPNIWKCNRCKEEIEQPDNMGMNTAINIMDAFFKSHKNCKKEVNENE